MSTSKRKFNPSVARTRDRIPCRVVPKDVPEANRQDGYVEMYLSDSGLVMPVMNPDYSYGLSEEVCLTFLTNYANDDMSYGYWEEHEEL